MQRQTDSTSEFEGDSWRPSPFVRSLRLAFDTPPPLQVSLRMSADTPPPFASKLEGGSRHSPSPLSGCNVWNNAFKTIVCHKSISSMSRGRGGPREWEGSGRGGRERMGEGGIGEGWALKRIRSLDSFIWNPCTTHIYFSAQGVWISNGG